MGSLEFYPILFRYVTIVLGVVLMLWALFKRPSMSHGFTLFLCVFIAVVIGLIPEESETCLHDRPRYLYLFLMGEDRTGITDVGFLTYVRICRILLRDNYKLFFVLSAFIYTYGYLFFCRTLGNNERSVYPTVFVACIVAMGFLNYGVNTMRSGMALSVLLLGYGFGLKQKKIPSYLLMALSCLIHSSTLLPIIAYFVSTTNIKIRWYYFLWILLFIVSVLDIGGWVTSIIDFFHMDKLIDYVEDTEDSTYSTGFRLSFVLYSVFPIIVGYYYCFILHYKDKVYERLYKQYLFCNAIWLLFIRMAYTDRFAYLSWFLIPFVLILPATNSKIDHRYISGAFLFFLLMKLI